MYIIALMVLVGAAIYFRRLLAKTQALSARLKLTRVLRVAMPGPKTRESFRTYFVARGFAVRESDTIMDVLLRGDTSITTVPASRNLSWREIPVVLVAGFGDEGGSTFVYFRFESYPGVTFSAAAMTTICDNAAAECEDVVAYLNRMAAECPVDFPEPAPDLVMADSRLDADLAVLGLVPGASIEDVQTAYRAVCMKFHPDRLASGDVSAAVVENCSRRFRDATDAYKRVKAELTAHATEASWR